MVNNKRFNVYFRKAKEEFKKYERTKQIIFLAQASEKLWNAFNLLIESKLSRRIRSFKDLRNGVSELYAKTGLKLWINTFENAYSLHKFFYRGWTDEEGEVKNLFQNTLNEIILLKKIKTR